MWNPFASNEARLVPDDDAPPAAEAIAARLSEEPVMNQPPSRAETRHQAIAEISLMGETAIATLTAEQLSLQEGVEHLSDLLQELRETKAKNWVLDTQNVQYMDSACLGCLVQALNELAATGGRIALANADRNVQYLFRMTQLDRVFPICPDVMTAIQAVERQPDQENFTGR